MSWSPYTDQNSLLVLDDVPEVILRSAPEAFPALTVDVAQRTETGRL